MAIRPVFNAGGTGALTVTFKDETDNPVTPNEASWTLKKDRDVINERQDIVISPLDTSVDIVLSGDDLQGGLQCLIVEASYDSSLGSDLPLRDWILFEVKRPCIA